MARYWSDGYKETDTVGQAAPYEVTVADAVRWDAKQDPLFYDKKATIGSGNLLTSGTIAVEFQNMRQYVQEEGGKAIYIEILVDSVTKEYGYKSDNFEKVAAAFEKGKTVILHVLDTNEYAYLQTATKDYFKFVLFGKNDVTAFQVFHLYSNGLIANYFINVPVLYEWALQERKPTYTYSDVGADKEGTARDLIHAHDDYLQAHSDIRALIQQLQNRINTLANSDDVSLDQLAELVAYIKANRDLIEQVTNNKVSVADIVDNLSTSVAHLPLSARQGQVLRNTIEQEKTSLQNLISKEVLALRELINAISAGGSEGGTPVVSVTQADWNATEDSAGAIKNKPPIEKGAGQDSLKTSGENQAFTNNSVAFGYANTAGLKGYYISAIATKVTEEDSDDAEVVVPNKIVIFLSNTQVTDAPPLNVSMNSDWDIWLDGVGWADDIIKNNNLPSSSTGWEVGDEINVIFPNDHFILCGKIERLSDYDNCVEICDCTITSEDMLSAEELIAHFQEAGVECTTFSEILGVDDYTVSVPSKPTCGIVNISSSSFVEGAYNNAAGSFSHAEGAETFVAGNFGHAEGQRTTAGYSAHAEGNGTKALGKEAHAEGYRTNATGNISHAEGKYTIASGYISHAEGEHTEASGYYSHAEGKYTEATGKQSHSEGLYTVAKAVCSHAEGHTCYAIGACSHAEGWFSNALGDASHAEGLGTNSLPIIGITEKTDEQIIEHWDSVHFSLAKGEASHVEGYNCLALGARTHAEGYMTRAVGNNSHAEGQQTLASGLRAHSEGFKTNATGDSSHAEGMENTSQGKYAHTEGSNNTAIGIRSHAEGYKNTTSGFASHVEGQSNIISAKGNSSHVQGKYNLEDTAGIYAHIVGGGNSSAPSNLHTIRWENGQGFFRGGTTTEGADYAEYFEWIDGNPDGEDRVGLLVTLDGEKIKLANAGDEILGIISGTAAVLGDNYECEWNGKYLTDDFGRIQYEMVEEFNEEVVGFDEETDEPITEKKSLGFFKHPVLNPDYDASQEYVNRADRPEWDAVGMLGKLYVRDDGTCQVNGYVTVGENGIATKHDEKTNMRVLSRVNENIIKVLLK